jgi:heptosyltransferase I
MNLDKKRILIIKPSSLGDIVHTLPVAHALKRIYPNCYLGWIVQDTFRGILDDDPAVDQVIAINIPSTSDPSASWKTVLEATWATVETIAVLRRKFSERPFEVILDFHASLRSGIMGMVNPGGFRIGFSDAKELNTYFQKRLVVVQPAHQHAVDKNIAMADFIDCAVRPEDFHVSVDSRTVLQVKELIGKWGIVDGDKIVYANPVARWETKLWTQQAWAECADGLIHNLGVKLIFSGSKGDSGYISGIIDKMRNDCVMAAGKLTLPQAVALIKESDLYLGVDSGPMHIAAFVGTPVVAVFGPTDPRKVGPYGPGHRVVSLNDLTCLGCRRRSCSHRSCLEKLEASTVIGVVESLMGWNVA